jgi:hydroxypyruvate reductase
MTSPRIPLNELQELTWELLASGARIDEINTLRRHLDRVKGGGLARAAGGARILSLILSDVVGDRLEAIASGPTAPDPTTLEDVETVLHKYGLRDRISRAAQQAMQETLKPGDPVFDRVENRIIANNETALRAAQAQARREGFAVELLDTALQGEASVVGVELASRLRQEVAHREGPFCLLAGGETTVTVRGYGKGGRNQEVALAAMPELAGLQDVLMLSLATDGQDGPTVAAGAVIDGESWGRANALGIDVDEALSANNSAPVFQALSDQLVTSATGTNVNDLVMMFKL